MKKTNPYLSFGALFLAVSLLCAALFSRFDSFLMASIESVDAAPKPLIILDAGHGGEDGGASGSNGVLEKDLNLALTSSLASLLRLAGYEVLESRTEDKLLYDEGTKKGHKKQSDLQNRLALTQQNPDSIFISIHMNTFPTADCRGVQVWYSQGNDASQDWARTVQGTVRTLLQPENNRKPKAATSGIYILRHALTPAILIECGFISTPDECERLCDASYQKALVLTLFSAIDEKMRTQP